MKARETKTNRNPRVAEKRNSVTWLKQYFEGKWSFKRVIFCSGDSPYGVADGTACFSPSDEGKLIYNESGKLSLSESGQTFPFFRSFIYLFDEDRVEVYFNDGPNSGQLYQSYRLEDDHLTLSPTTGHICRDDCYNGTYEMLSSGEFKLETLIKGPRKEFKIATHAKKD